MKWGTVAIIGRSNVGKSTLLNRLLNEKVAIVSDKPQTTRTRILGIAHVRDAQIAFLDTPGLHEPQHLLNTTSKSDSGSTRAAQAHGPMQVRACRPAGRPTLPTTRPAATLSPTATSISDKCASTENSPCP